ncbi:hypothetical protein A9Q89_04750 [Gammaproteobacteria bacterium 53_120_T64]|nr:hypothetical protein A9Q89_04750 [Gammaproteobacteria bacterium 53_120_T64]
MIFLQELKELYLSLPLWVKTPIAKLPPSFVLGKDYRKQLRFLNESSNWSADQYIEFQRNKLFEVVEFSVTTVPYYRDLFRKLNIPARLQSMDQFFELPLLTKEIIKDEGGRMISEAVSKTARYPITTGGTSGTPMAFHMASEAYGKEWAFVHDLLGRYGVTSSDRKIGLRGVAFPQAEKGVYYQYNPIYRELQLSPFHLTEAVVKSLASVIENFDVKYIHGYPSSVSQFASIAAKYSWGKKLDLKAVLLVSESVYPHQKEKIEELLNCPVISFYGHSERLIFAGTVPDREGYFVDPRYGYTEVLDGELVGTGFINMAMPMLRYQTGDRCSGIDYAKEGRGVHAFPRISGIDGRWLQEMLIGNSGSRISITALNMHSNLFSNVERFQFYQDTPGRAELRIVPTKSFEFEKDGEVIMRAFAEKVGSELQIELKIVETVELTVRGKQMFLIQKLDC